MTTFSPGPIVYGEALLFDTEPIRERQNGKGERLVEVGTECFVLVLG